MSSDMRVYSIVSVLTIPFASAFAYIIYRSYVNKSYTDPITYLLLPLLLILMVLHMFKPQIDHWWHKRNPPKLASFITEWLEKHSDFYASLSAADQQKFRERLSIHLESREFSMMRQEKENLPEDFKAIIAHNLIQLTFGQEDYLLDPYERVIVYNHPFPSPKKQFLHNVEVDHEDGVLLMSTEQLFPAMLNKDSFYNVGMHAYVEAYLNTHSKLNLPDLPEDISKKLEQVSRHKFERVEATVGYKIENLHIVAINYFFIFPNSFKEHLPELYQAYASIFNQNP